MKQIPILSGKAHVVELPDGAPTPDVINTGQSHLSWLDIDINLPDINLPPGNWKIVGWLSEITEEQACMLVAKVMNGQHYQNYNYKSVIERWVKTAIESLESAIEAEGYYLDENPIPEPDISRYPNDDWIADYNNAQSSVLSRERCLLLMRVDV